MLEEEGRARGQRMTLRLHRFPLSHFSEKGRALLDFKQLSYQIVEHQLGVPQLGVYRLSGQRKVPVLEDGATVVSDSTEIALYLERTFADGRRLFPESEEQRRDAVALEDRIDRVFGYSGVVVWFDWAVNNDEKMAELLSLETWGLPRRGGALLAGVARRAGRQSYIKRWNEKAEERTRDLLTELSERLERQPYLTGAEPNIADVAAAGLSFHLKFPKSRYLAVPELSGQGIPDLVEDPVFCKFFDWRDRFYSDYLE